MIEDTGALRAAGQPAADRRQARSVRRALAGRGSGSSPSLIAVLGVVIVRRWRGATRPQRRALTLVYASGGLVLALYAIWSVFGMLDVATGSQETLERARVIALATVPFAFLAGLLRARVVGRERGQRAGRAARRGRRRPAGRAGRRAARPVARARLLAARARRVGRRARGRGRRCPTDPSRCTPVERDGRPIAMLVHDPSLAEEPELVHAVGGAAALALENERLTAELRATVSELRASRARIVESADAARRKIERDLHDGAQQRLVALALEPAAGARARRRRSGRRPRSCSTARAQNLDEAIRELRELARGIHPAVLSDRGLGSRAGGAGAADAAADRDRRGAGGAAAGAGRGRGLLRRRRGDHERRALRGGVARLGRRALRGRPARGVGRRRRDRRRRPGQRLRAARAERPDRGARRAAGGLLPARARNDRPRRHPLRGG